MNHQVVIYLKNGTMYDLLIPDYRVANLMYAEDHVWFRIEGQFLYDYQYDDVGHFTFRARDIESVRIYAKDKNPIIDIIDHPSSTC